MSTLLPNMKKSRISACVAVLVVFGRIGYAQATDVATPSDQQSCADLAKVRDGAWSVSFAEFVRPPFTVSDEKRPVPVSDSFCRVIAKAQPVSGSEIGFELWLPPKEKWNGKFAGVGSGGSLGAIPYKPLARELARGYATVATDNGHHSEAFDVSWALGRPDRIVDFGYRALHTVTQAGKFLTRAFYKTPPRHSYFIGCSQGGHHGLTEAQRFPEDYDGIVAGAPVYDWVGEMTGQAWNVRALRKIPQGAIRKEKLAPLYAAVAKACAGPDGLIDDPRACSFDPATIKCEGEDRDSCLTTSEVEAVRAFYAGPKTSTGAQIYPGLPRGSEGDWDILWSDPKHLGGSWEGFYRFMVFDNPEWELAKINFDRDPRFAKEKLGSTMDPDNPDLKAFADRGGKLIVYHGWSDYMVPSQVSIDYWNAVNGKLGESRTSAFYRLFMVPGMAHCADGPGADVLFHFPEAPAVPLEPERDMLTALEQWVEQGRVPSKFVASRVNEQGAIERTRLLCPYPNVARYRGEGDVLRAENFTCSAK
jgi:feruloyl esterase